MCWLPKVPAWFLRLAELVAAFEQGSMLRPGGAADQPAWYLPIVRSYVASREEFVADRLRQEAENRASLARTTAAARGGR